MSTTAGFGPEVVAAIDEAFLMKDRDRLVEFARRALVMCAGATLKGDHEEATDWAKAFEYLTGLAGETFAGLEP